jgi:hypothetical protein
MKANHCQPEILTKRTWYGLQASIKVGPGLIHRSGFFGVMIPHPGLANWILRKGMIERLRMSLSLCHEFAHFQTLPLILLYAGVLLTAVTITGVPSLSGLLVLLASLQAVWEAMSEFWTIAQDTEYYRRSYAGVSAWPRVIFWALCGFMAPLGWMLV